MYNNPWTQQPINLGCTFFVENKEGGDCFLPQWSPMKEDTPYLLNHKILL